MMKRLILSLGIALMALTMQAQTIRGINIDAGNGEVVVYMDGRQVSLPTSSCFIANLPAGRYLIEIYSAESFRDHSHHHNKNRLYRDYVRLDGREVKTIRVYDPDYGRYPEGPDRYPICPDTHRPLPDYRPGHGGHCGIMSEDAFEDFCDELEDAVFDSSRQELIKGMMQRAYFTCKQCKDLVDFYKFDRDKVNFMKMIYPSIADKENFHKVLKELDFESSRDEVERFVREYHRSNR